jgi:hypothetical protein
MLLLEGIPREKGIASWLHQMLNFRVCLVDNGLRPFVLLSDLGFFFWSKIVLDAEFLSDLFCCLSLDLRGEFGT